MQSNGTQMVIGGVMMRPRKDPVARPLRPSEKSLLCELVQQHPCLYNPNHADYKNNHMKDRVYQEIAEKLNASVEEVKKIWRNIRDSFNRRERKKKHGTRSSRGPKMIWHLEECTQFLYQVEHENVFNNINDIIIKEEDDESDVEDADSQWTDNDMTTDDYADDNPPIAAVETPPTPPSQSATDKTPLSETPSRKAGKRKKIISESSASASAIIENFPKICERTKAKEVNLRVDTRSTTSTIDSIHSFFKSMADAVVRLPEDLQVKAKMETCKIICSFEMEAFGRTRRTQSEPSSSE